MIDHILSKRYKEYDTIIFKIYKSGIDEETKKLIQKEEIKNQNNEVNVEPEYFIKKPNYKNYWRKEFFKLREEFQVYMNSKKEINYYKDKGLFFINKIDYRGEKYSLLYDYEMIDNENIVILFHLYREEKNNDNYDEFLEKLKIDISDFWVDKIKTTEDNSEICFWLEDKQSQELSYKSYPIINKIENKLRFFIDKVMICNRGLSWNKIFKKEKSIVKNYENRISGYKKDIDSFNNINNFLLSIDALKLTEIMYYEKENIWEKCFKNLFEYEWQDYCIKSNFKDEWEELCKYRNHIAHNKFIDYKSYNQIIYLSDKIEIEIDEAEKEFDRILEDKFGEYIEEIYDMNYIEEYDEYYDMNNYNKIEREQKIYKEVVSFLEKIRQNLKKDIPNLCIKYHESIMENDEEDGLKLFLELIMKDNLIQIMKIEDSLNLKAVVVEMKKCKGVSLTNYLISVRFENKEEAQIIIGHDRNEFIADGAPEYHEQLMEQLHHDFFNEINEKLFDFFTNSDE